MKHSYTKDRRGDDIHWRDWGRSIRDEALSRGQLIFLTIGDINDSFTQRVSAQVFSDPDIAQFLNDEMIPVATDWHERPDLREIYRFYAIHAIGQSVSPLAVWLTPQLKPVLCVRFPAAARESLATWFLEILRSIRDEWLVNRSMIELESARVVGNLENAMLSPPLGDAVPDFVEDAESAFDRAYTYFFENFDEQHGGVGGAPKYFPALPLKFLLRCAALQSADEELVNEVIRFAETTLSSVFKSGFCDGVGGGVFRYAKDDAWLLPEFEKRLVDQAEAATVALEVARLTGDSRYAHAGAEILDYVERELTDGESGFLNGAVALSDDPNCGAEYYLWSAGELKRSLGKDFDWFAQLYRISEAGNVSLKLDPAGALRGYNVLHRAESVGEFSQRTSHDISSLAVGLESCLRKLRRVRSVRSGLQQDGKCVTGANARMVSAFIKAAAARDLLSEAARERFRRTGLRVAEWIWQNAWDDAQTLLRHVHAEDRWHEIDFAEDYAQFIAAALDIYDATFAPIWIERALKLFEIMDGRFADPDGGGYFQTPSDRSLVILRIKSFSESSEESVNSLAATCSFRLGMLLRDASCLRRGSAILQSARDKWMDAPWRTPGLMLALEWGISAPCRVWIVGADDNPALVSLLEAAQEGKGRRRVVIYLKSSRERRWWSSYYPAQLPECSQVPTAFVESSMGLSRGLSSPEQLRSELGRLP
ncbi:MAG: thioredoxin domain-containing protein [Synoicihabitans sp.]